MNNAAYYATASVICKFFLDHGFSLEQACGVVANADAESSMRVAVIGDKGHAFGLFQLHYDRIALIKKGANIDMRTADAAGQCAGVLWELNHSERRAMIALRGAKTAFAAGHDFCEFYERPAEAAQYQIRGAKAENWREYFQSYPPK